MGLNFLSEWPSRLFSRYDIWRLVDRRVLPEGRVGNRREQIICDIDKTYLETNFETLVGLAKIPFEGAEDKVTVTGASDVLRILRWGNMRHQSELAEWPRALHFVSSSPPQLRLVLQKKLLLDGLDHSSDSFKNQAYNLRKRRFDQIKQQVAYKTASIGRILAQEQRPSSFYFLGDNAESDFIIYLGLKLYTEQYLSDDGFIQYLKALQVNQTVAQDVLSRITVQKRHKVPLILIRQLTGYPAVNLQPFSRLVVHFENYFEAFLAFYCFGLVEEGCLWPIVQSFHNNYHFPLGLLLGYLEGVDVYSLPEDRLNKELQMVMEKLAAYDVDKISPRQHFCPYIEPEEEAQVLSELSEKQIIEFAEEWRTTKED